MLNPQQAINTYDFEQLSQTEIRNLDQLVANSQEALDHSSFEIENIDFTDEQVASLVAFLKTLTDPCVKSRECLAPWIPSTDALDEDPNGDQMTAIDKDGTAL